MHPMHPMQKVPGGLFTLPYGISPGQKTLGPIGTADKGAEKCASRHGRLL